MQFKNTQNPCLELKDGNKIWKSRNVAVSVMWIQDGEICLVKRGKDMTHAGKWCFPCGYLDWDESVEEAAVRELYEETGCMIETEDLEFVGIDSDPSKFGQNISVMFKVVGTFKWDLDYIPDENEVEDLKFFPLIMDGLPEMAFDHEERCEEFIKTDL